MFKALTVLFFAYYLYRFINPINLKKHIPFVNKINKEGFKIELYNEDELKDVIKNVIRMCAFFFFILFMQILEFLYLMFAVSHDTYKLPTLAMILWFIIAYATSSKKKGKSLNVKRLDKLGYKIKNKTIAILNICYFGYMFYLMFIV